VKSEKVILVDNDDNDIGEMGKIEVHRKALLHRAVSVFIFNSKKQMLIQRRALTKYHSPGLWTNTACTHPYPGETTIEAASRRSEQEMGIDTDLIKIFDFTYKERLDNNLTEYEFDHVFIGFSDKIPDPDPAEVCEFKYVDIDSVLNRIKEIPDNFTVWFRKIAERVSNLAVLHYQSFEPNIIHGHSCPVKNSKI